MKQTLAAFFAAMALAAVPLFAGDDPPASTPSASEESASPKDLCCALPEGHGLNTEAPDAYQMIGVTYDPRNPLSLDPVGVSTKLTALKRKCRTDAEYRTAEVLEILIEKKTHALYDWFLAHLRGSPDSYQGTGLEHVAVFDQFFLHLASKRGRSAKLELSDYQEELVSFLSSAYRATNRYDVASMSTEVEKLQREKEVAKKAIEEGFKGFYGWRLPWVFGCAAALAVAGGVALHQFERDGVAPVDERLPQVIDRDTLRHPVAPGTESPSLERDPAFQHGKEAADDLFGPPPTPKN